MKLSKTHRCASVYRGLPRVLPKETVGIEHWQEVLSCAHISLSLDDTADVLRAVPHEALQRPIFKLSSCHPKQLSAPHAKHSLPPSNLRWWLTFTQHALGQVDAEWCPGVHSQTHTHTHTHYHMNSSSCTHSHAQSCARREHFSLPTTINVNSNPLLTDFLYTWLGRLAKPT